MILVVTTLTHDIIKKSELYQNCKYIDSLELYNSIYEEWKTVVLDKERLEYMVHNEMSIKLKNSIRNSKNGCIIYKVDEKYKEDTLNNIIEFVYNRCNNVQCLKLYDVQTKIKKITKKTLNKFCNVEYYL